MENNVQDGEGKDDMLGSRITVMAPNVKLSPLPSCMPKTWGCGVGPPLEPSMTGMTATVWRLNIVLR